jgi:hypothetical protein
MLVSVVQTIAIRKRFRKERIMFKIRNFTPVVILVLMLIVQFAAARTASASLPSNDAVSMLSNQAISTNQNKAPVSSFRSPPDVCFDVPLSELASCRNASQAATFAQAGFYSTLSEVGPATTLVEAVRQATEPFKNIEEAEAAGYGLFHGCVSGPQEGAMGVHFVNGDLVGDGILDPIHPEALLYEYTNGKAQFVGVEYVVIAEAWHANNEAPPVLMGQLFNYVGSPNRYGIPAFYELHVWAWEGNPSGMFADWNPRVSCEEYSAEDSPNDSSH